MQDGRNDVQFQKKVLTADAWGAHEKVGLYEKDAFFRKMTVKTERVFNYRSF